MGPFLGCIFRGQVLCFNCWPDFSSEKRWRYSSPCEYCLYHRNDISKLVADLKNLPELTDEAVTNYGVTFKTITEHLEKHHELRRAPSKSRELMTLIGCVGTATLMVVGGVLTFFGLVVVNAGDSPWEYNNLVTVGVVILVAAVLLGILSYKKL